MKDRSLSSPKHHVFFLIFGTFFSLNFFAKATPISSITQRQTTIDYQIPGIPDMNSQTPLYPIALTNDFDIQLKLPDSNTLSNLDEGFDLIEKAKDSEKFYPKIESMSRFSPLEFKFENWNTYENLNYNANTPTWQNDNNMARNPFSSDDQELVPNQISNAYTFRPITPEESETFKQYLNIEKNVICQTKIHDETISGLSVNTESTRLLLAFAVYDDKMKDEFIQNNNSFIPYPGISGAKVNAAFYKRFSRAARGASDNILKTFLNNEIKTIDLIGFTYSGIFAQLLGLSLAPKVGKNININIITIGQPRVGNVEFARALNQVATVYRITLGHDPTPRRPVEYEGEKYVHSGTEIWFKTSDSAYFCTSGDEAGESKECINKPSSKGPNESKTYFGISFDICDASPSPA
ncbi:hypothetical protein G9A89_002314 [Geosiphon pyriformis]|nr:hypothetical protein G9A89_002314 [Geosiphon pyriformis]